jgi:hypothetical protein
MLGERKQKVVKHDEARARVEDRGWRSPLSQSR